MIRRMEIRGYRALKYNDVRLSNFQILVGPNASGKSTFLDSINIIKDVLNHGPQQAIEKRASRFNELLWNQQGNQFEMAVEMQIPEEIQAKFKNEKFSFVRYEISFQLNDKDEVIIGGENLWLIKNERGAILDDSREKQMTFFPIEPNVPESSFFDRKRAREGWRKVVSKTEHGNDYFKSETTDWNINYKFGPLKASLARIPEDPERFPASLWAKNSLLEGIQILQLNSNAMRWSCRPDVPTTFQTDGSNLPKVIQYLRKEHPESFSQWMKHVQTALPEILTVDVFEKADDRFLYLNVQHKNGLKVPSWVISDGTLRLLAQTIIAYLPEKNRIYMIEEPENGLHPLAIESIYQSLSSCYDNQIILASHSPAILRLTEPKDILCFAKTSSGAVAIVHGNEHPKLKDWRTGIDLAMLHAAGILQ